jgi:hypothetical protein
MRHKKELIECDIDINLSVRQIDKISRYVLKRQHWRTRKRGIPPRHVVRAAYTVRERFDIEALGVVLEFLCACPYGTPRSIGAATWDLGGYVFDTLAKYEDTIRQKLAAA